METNTKIHTKLCTNCNIPQPAISQDGHFIDDGISMNTMTLGHYGGFTDCLPSPDQQDVWAHLCHDCAKLLFDTLPGLARFARIHGGHSNISWNSSETPDGTTMAPCCQYAWTWDMTDPKNIIDYWATPDLQWTSSPKSHQDYYKEFPL